MFPAKCRQCGAELHDGKTCADRLYELFLSVSCGGEKNYLEAAARFVLHHPQTHSAECVDLARTYSAGEGAQPVAQPIAAQPVAEPKRACALQAFTRRVLCKRLFENLSLRSLRRLH